MCSAFVGFLMECMWCLQVLLGAWPAESVVSDVMACLADSVPEPTAAAAALTSTAEDQARHAQYLFLRAVLAVEADKKLEQVG